MALSQTGRVDVYNRLTQEAYSILKDMCTTKFEDMIAVHGWINDIIQVAEKSGNIARAMAANMVMLVLGRAWTQHDHCDLDYLGKRVQDEILTTIDVP
jgi:hypothetical protein